jgi:malonyl-CoA/methylmalonyl-CoA synthetase
MKTRADNDNLFAVLARRFPRALDACCLETSEGLHYTWRDLLRASARLANLMKALGLRPGARVAVQVEKSPEALMLYLASLRAGLIFLPLNTAYQAGEIDYFIGNAKPELVVCSPERLAGVEPIARRHGVKHVYTLGAKRDGTLLVAAAPQADEFRTVRRRPGDLAAILYTSGTTGRSKGAMLSHGNLASNARTLQRYWGWRRGDVLLHALPIFHVHGLFVAVHGALYNGSRMIWLARFDPAEVIRQLPRATVFMGVPTMYVRLLDEPGFDRQCCTAMRLFISGSAPLRTETFEEFERRTGMRILERYGMSETIMLTSNPCDGERIAGTVGRPLPGVELRIVDDNGKPCGPGENGVIQVRGPNVFRGYWRMPAKTRSEFTADGFFRTGDVGQFDANGYVRIVGRNKDLIITGGYNVYPKEIETIIDELPGVFESAVIGLPDRDFGEAVTAVVVPRPGAQLDAQALIASLRPRIAGFKVPRRIFIVSELPRNAMGKVQKNILRDSYGQ